ncbi:MAG: hypothetical protein IJN39_03025 [Clostridia bacterium]|nr:hypothetical protein [Clostridia bacterium]
MANIVQVSTQEAQASNSRLRTNLEEANRQMDTLMATVRSTDDWWEGETTKAFIQSFENGVQVFKKYLEKLQYHGDAMLNSVQKQHSHDAGLASHIRKY